MISSEPPRTRSFCLLAALGAAAVAVVLMSCGSGNPAVDPTPTPITDLAAAALNDTTVRLHWTAPSASGRAVATYDIRYAESAEALDSIDAHIGWPFFETPARPGSPDSVTISSLKRVTRYFFRVAGVASGGETAPEGGVVSIVTVPDTIPPAPITDLRVSIREDTAVTLLWTAPGDDGTQGRAHGYIVLVAPGVHSTLDPETARQVQPLARPFPAGVTEVVRVDGLLQKSSYSLAVVSRDEAGQESLPSNVLTVTTDRSPKDWYVYANGSGDTPTIQAAIDSTRAGEVIWIGPGMYRENLRIIGQAEALIGIEGAEVTIIDGSTRPASVIEIRATMEDTTRIIGLTITGGSGSSVQPGSGDGVDGAGLFAQDANLRVEACHIRANGHDGGDWHTADWGGGIYAEKRYHSIPPSVSVVGSRIENNRALKNGGGVAITNGAMPIISQCVVQDNEALAGDGGGIWILNFSGIATVTLSHILSNVAADHGGGIYVGHNRDDSAVLISGNLIESNQAFQLDTPATYEVGAGLWMLKVAGFVEQNTIVMNGGPSDGGLRGGGVSTRDHTNLIFRRNIIAFSLNNGGYSCFEKAGIRIENNVFWDNFGGDLIDCPTEIDAHGNLSIDPQFCNPSQRQWSLASTSPALQSPAGRIGAETGVGCQESQSAFKVLHRLLSEEE